MTSVKRKLSGKYVAQNQLIAIQLMNCHALINIVSNIKTKRVGQPSFEFRGYIPRNQKCFGLDSYSRHRDLNHVDWD